MTGRPMASPARALIPAARGARPGHHADPSREVRATSDLTLEPVTVPHKSSATSSNRYINRRSAYSAGTDDQAPEPRKYSAGLFTVGSGLAVTLRDRSPRPQARWALFRGTNHSFHETRSTSDVFAGGAPGARTLNPRIKRGLPGRAERSTCADATRECTESTHRAGIRPALVPRVVPRPPRRGSQDPSR
jgi:hypothetical protein